MSVSKKILSFFNETGVKHIFGIPGSYLSDMNRWWPRKEELTFVRSTHETGAALMAQGYVLSGGRYGAIFTTEGPGMLNCANGLMSGSLNDTNLLYISGAVPLNGIAKGHVQDSMTYGVDTQKYFGEIASFQGRIVNTQEFRRKWPKGVAELLSGDGKVVHFPIGQDVFVQPVDRDFDYEPFLKDQRKVKFYPLEREFEEVLEVLQKAKESKGGVCVFLGNELFRNSRNLYGEEVEKKFLKMIETLNIPYFTATTNEGFLHEHNDRLYLGKYGLASQTVPLLYVQEEEIDTMICIGTKMIEAETNSFFNLDKINNFIMIGDKSHKQGRTFDDKSKFLYGDLGKIFDDLSQRVEKSNIRFDFDARIEELKNSVECDFFQYDLVVSDETPVMPNRMLVDLFEGLKEESVHLYACGGQSMSYAWHYLENPLWKFFGCFVWGTMGFAVSAAVGGACAIREKQTDEMVVCITGDGSTLMNGNEMKVAADFKLPIIFVILNDQGLGTIFHSVDYLYKDADKEETNFNALSHEQYVDFKKLGESFGMKSYYIDQPGQLNKEFLMELKALNEPVLLDCRVQKMASPLIESRNATIKKLKKIPIVIDGEEYQEIVDYPYCF